MSAVDPAAWNGLDHAPSPFLEWGFLRALEVSGSIGPEAGWAMHLLLAYAEPTEPGADGGEGPSDRLGSADAPSSESRLVGAVTAFVKDHSYGEYIFDFQWANASEQAGIPYYPKLVIAAPVTPATGRRILLHDGLDSDSRERVAQALIQATRDLAEDTQCRSTHWLFCTSEELGWLAEAGFAPRASIQFHWHNRGYESFDGFLGTMRSRKRKQLRKERSRVRAALGETGAIEWRDGVEIDDEDVEALDGLYRSTTDQHWGRAYLEPGFFAAARRLIPERMRFLRVRREDHTIAGALFFETEQGLYGRYWGCFEEVDCLHFEASYYAGIDRCIRLGLPLFEAGAQGEHKLLRGFEPAECRSAHMISHPGLDQAVRRFLQEEANAVRVRLDKLAAYGPYRRGETGDGQPSLGRIDPDPSEPPSDG
jgi:predicted N-acyltransferase